MKRYVLFLFVLIPLSLPAAPVPMPPTEDLRTWKDVGEFDAETIGRVKNLPQVEDLRNGYQYTTDKGVYKTYFTSEGMMVLSTIPDGKMKYGYFGFDGYTPLKWNNQDAPTACITCHNRNRER